MRYRFVAALAAGVVATLTVDGIGTTVRAQPLPLGHDFEGTAGDAGADRGLRDGLEESAQPVARAHVLRGADADEDRGDTAGRSGGAQGRATRSFSRVPSGR